MKQTEAQTLLNKNIFVVLNSGFRYNGKVIQIFEDSILILDKFGSKVSLSLDNISICEVKE